MNINFDTIKSTIGSIPKNTSKEAAKIGGFLVSVKNGVKTKCLKRDIFQKAAVRKDTVIGYGAILAATFLAIKCLKGIIGKIKETDK